MTERRALVLKMLSHLKTPKDFLNANPKLHQRPEAKKGLAEDAAEGLPEENPEGYFQSTPLGTNLELEGLPEGTDSPHYTQGFSTDCTILSNSLQS